MGLVNRKNVVILLAGLTSALSRLTNVPEFLREGVINPEARMFVGKFVQKMTNEANYDKKPDVSKLRSWQDYVLDGARGGKPLLLCPEGQKEYHAKFGSNNETDRIFVPEFNYGPQSVAFPNGETMSITAGGANGAVQLAEEKSLETSATFKFKIPVSSWVDPHGYSKGFDHDDPEFPKTFGILTFDFPYEIEHLRFQVRHEHLPRMLTNTFRFRLRDGQNKDVYYDSYKHSRNIRTKRGDYWDYSYRSVGLTRSENGLDESVYIQPKKKIKSLSVDIGILAYDAAGVGETLYYNHLLKDGDLAFCVPDMSASQQPPQPEPQVEAEPRVDEPVLAVVRQLQESGPVETSEGTNKFGPVGGSTTIVGLTGQQFQFEGRAGLWYSMVSTKSFQWNNRMSKFEDCPGRDNTFFTGLGLSLFGADGAVKSRIEVTVVNEHNTNIGCGNSWEKNNDYTCLGAGSLQVVVDGHKIVQGSDHTFEHGRVITYNTVAKCTRRWSHWDVPGAEGAAAVVSRGLRTQSESVMGVIQNSAKPTMRDVEGCQRWMSERQAKKDLFEQTGTHSTVIIQTGALSLHIEYKQEQERCSAHEIDAWITSVSPEILAEDWQGIVGETKDANFRPTEEAPKQVDRKSALRFEDDGAYAVMSPFSVKCKGCTPR